MLILCFTTSIMWTKSEDVFYFQYNNEQLIDIIHRLAAKKGVNIVFPAKHPITSSITIFLDTPFTIDQAWEKLYTILDMAGYSLIDKDSQYTIVKTEKDISKEALPIFIGVPPQKIPDSDERIRYLYYLANLKVGDSDKFASSELGIVLKEMLPDNTSFQVDSNTNGLIISDKANNIKAVMEIVTRLDNATEQENIDIIKLHNTDATMIAGLFTEILKTNENARYRFEAKKQLSEATYFPKNMRIFPLPRTNSLLALGSQAAIDRIRDFLAKYVDIELESGKSMLHIYQLQYMDAEKIAAVLTKVLIEPQESSGQSKSEKGTAVINPVTQERFFDEIIIQTDKTTKTGDDAKYFGNNNLIIACRNEDWLRIKPLIEKLDQSQPQVIIEVLVANLNLQDTRALGALTRNPLELGFPKGVNIQSAQIGDGIIVQPVPVQPPPTTTVDPSTLACDMMGNRITLDSSGAPVVGPNVTSTFPAGSTAIAFGESSTDPLKSGKAWSVLQMLDLFSYSKVISHPHLIATNNTKALVKIGQTRLLADQTAGSGGGTAVVNQKNIEAFLTVNITPRIFTSDLPGGKDDTVNLTVEVNITDFVPGNDANTRITRVVKTTALLKNGQILALGGIVSHQLDDGVNESPILSKIPILGYLAKKRTGAEINTNITIFIAPTIIEPRLRGGTGKYTEDYVSIGKKYAAEGDLFDSLQDPITRWFFRKSYNPDAAIQDFMEQDEFKRRPPKEEYKTVVDAEQAASIEEIAEPKKETEKKSKSVVLTNLNADGSTHEVTKVPQRPPSLGELHTASPQKQASSKNDDALLALLQKDKQGTQLASADIKAAHTAALKDRLQQLLQEEENPLL